MLLIWKWGGGEILVNAVYCGAGPPEKEHRLQGREGGWRPGGFAKTQEVKISGSLYQFPKSALCFLSFSSKTNKNNKRDSAEKCQQRAHILITRKWITSTSFHRKGDDRRREREREKKKGKIKVVYVYKSPPLGCIKSQMRNRSSPRSFGELDARPPLDFFFFFFFARPLQQRVDSVLQAVCERRLPRLTDSKNPPGGQAGSCSSSSGSSSSRSLGSG